eukprot:350618-Chlamydomonas_euryale.AAC.1
MNIVPSSVEGGERSCDQSEASSPNQSSRFPLCLEWLRHDQAIDDGVGSEDRRGGAAPQLEDAALERLANELMQ